jgi:hypothetical protein
VVAVVGIEPSANAHCSGRFVWRGRRRCYTGLDATSRHARDQPPSVPRLQELPDDIRARMLEVRQRAGFVPNLFITRAHRSDWFRAFLIC